MAAAGGVCVCEVHPPSLASAASSQSRFCPFWGGRPVGRGRWGGFLLGWHDKLIDGQAPEVAQGRSRGSSSGAGDPASPVTSPTALQQPFSPPRPPPRSWRTTNVHRQTFDFLILLFSNALWWVSWLRWPVPSSYHVPDLPSVATWDCSSVLLYHRYLVLRGEWKMGGEQLL